MLVQAVHQPRHRADPQRARAPAFSATPHAIVAASSAASSVYTIIPLSAPRIRSCTSASAASRRARAQERDEQRRRQRDDILVRRAAARASSPSLVVVAVGRWRRSASTPGGAGDAAAAWRASRATCCPPLAPAAHERSRARRRARRATRRAARTRSSRARHQKRCLERRWPSLCACTARRCLRTHEHTSEADGDGARARDPTGFTGDRLAGRRAAAAARRALAARTSRLLRGRARARARRWPAPPPNEASLVALYTMLTAHKRGLARRRCYARGSRVAQARRHRAHLPLPRRRGHGRARARADRRRRRPRAVGQRDDDVRGARVRELLLDCARRAALEWMANWDLDESPAFGPPLLGDAPRAARRVGAPAEDKPALRGGGGGARADERAGDHARELWRQRRRAAAGGAVARTRRTPSGSTTRRAKLVWRLDEHGTGGANATHIHNYFMYSTHHIFARYGDTVRNMDGLNASAREDQRKWEATRWETTPHDQGVIITAMDACEPDIDVRRRRLGGGARSRKSGCCRCASTTTPRARRRSAARRRGG